MRECGGEMVVVKCKGMAPLFDGKISEDQDDVAKTRNISSKKARMTMIKLVT